MQIHIESKIASQMGGLFKSSNPLSQKKSLNKEHNLEKN